MQDENKIEQTNQTDMHLSNGTHLILKKDKELTWDDYCTYQDLGSGIKGILNENQQMEVDLGGTARSSREQKLWLIRFFWDAYNTNFNTLKLSEITELYKPIKELNPLKELAEVLKD